ncbi:hypothetical protein HGRIS_001247 [Hohenbuehelia grisea]|uniref:XPG N-terminal domain-containing protein n=1 Tax=Hohenbuehelia grisea TaxID=104357 RepID=A0ABR3JPR7_9AGAR
MGVSGLWDPLTEYAMEQGFMANKRGDHMYRIGVDASIWLNRAQTKFLKHHYQAGENPELHLLFSWLTHLLKSPLIVVFVFDGPHRPANKRKKSVKQKPHYLTDRFATLLKPSGSTATIAGFLDAVVTGDSDVFVFGAVTVISNPQIKKLQDSVSTYAAEDIRKAPISLTEGGVLLFALLSGGDYHSGITGIGPSIAHALAKSGLGDGLLHAFKTLSPTELDEYIVTWRESLRLELCTDNSGFLGQRLRALANEVPDDFPSLSVIRLYLQPLVSANTTPFSQWLLRQPNATKLAFQCERFFSWGSSKHIKNSFVSRLLEGFIFRLLCVPFAELDHFRAFFNGTLSQPTFNQGSIVRIVSSNEINGLPYFTIQVSTSAFTSAAVAGLTGTRNSSSAPLKPVPKFKTVHIPVAIFAYGMPQMYKTHRRLHPSILNSNDILSDDIASDVEAEAEAMGSHTAAIIDVDAESDTHVDHSSHPARGAHPKRRKTMMPRLTATRWILGTQCSYSCWSRRESN